MNWLPATYKALAEEGTATGTVVVDAASTSSWGYGPFLRRRGADDGEVIRVTFDLMESTARLALENTDALDDDQLGEAFA